MLTSTFVLHDLEKSLQKRVSQKDLTLAHLRWTHQLTWCHGLIKGGARSEPDLAMAIREEIAKADHLKSEYEDLLHRFIANR